MTSKLALLLKKLDIFGPGVSFNIRGKETVKSSVGGIFSIINNACCVCYSRI